MIKTPIAIALERQIPEHIREEYSTFVQFVKAYYEFLEQTQKRNLEDIRSLDATLDEFVNKFKKELSALFPSTGVEDERFLLKRIREFYRSRGSEESFKFLFRAFFNKEAEIYYPSKQILRASAGQWIQEKSIFVKGNEGKNLFDLNGKIITILTSRKHINVYSPRVRYYRDDIYEVYIDRAYISDISIGEKVTINGVEYGEIMPCPSKYTITRKGSGFSVGTIYNLPSTNGNGSIVKVTKVNSSGGIEKVQIISFGLDYKTTFFAKLSNSYFQPLEYFHPVSYANIDETSPPTGFTDRNGLFPETDFNRTSGFYGDTTTGYMDYGYIISNTYFAYQSDYKGSDLTIDLDPYFGQGDYVGQIIGEFYTNALNGVVIDESIAEIMIELGAVAIYPGYYNSTDGFISDEIYIQDGKYYQLFSYVIKVEEQLDTYVDIVKTLLHPAGYEVFAQYNIKNDFIVSTVPLDAFVRYQYFDRQFVFDQDIELTAHLYKDNGVLTPDTPPFSGLLGSPSEIKKYSQLYEVDILGNLTLTNNMPSGSDGYLSDFGDSVDLNRNQTQTSSLKNNWDIVLGNQNSALGTVAPLVDSPTFASSNFANRTLGSTDTYNISKSGINSPAIPFSQRISNDITALKTDTISPVETYVGGAFGSVPGLAWDFSGQTWQDLYSATDPYTAIIWGLGATDFPQPIDEFTRDVTYDRSIIPLEQTSVLAVSTRSSSLNPTEFGFLKQDFQVSIDSDPPILEIAKFKQPILLGFTANIIAGSKSITLNDGFVVNTMIGLKVIKVSGIGSFGIDAIVESTDMVNGKILTVSVPHTTSGTISFYVEASSQESEIADLAGTITAIHSGLSWDFSGQTFNKSITSVDSFTRDVSYNRSTIPLEQTSVTTVHSGLTWDLYPYATSSAVNLAVASEFVNQKANSLDKSETLTTSHSGLSWEFSGDTFKEAQDQINMGSALVHVGVHDFVLTPAAAQVLSSFIINGMTGLTGAAVTLAVTFNTRYSTATTLAQTISNPSSQSDGALKGDLSGNGVLNGLDATLINDIYYGTIDTQNYAGLIDSVANVKARYAKLLGQIAEYPSSTLNQLFAAGYITSNAKRDITKSTGDTINSINSGVLYINPYTSSDYNTVTNNVVFPVFNYGSGDYFASGSDTRAIT